jgi:hypothetical protein
LLALLGLFGVFRQNLCGLLTAPAHPRKAHGTSQEPGQDPA